MTKKSQYPKDTNQLAKLIVDLATGETNKKNTPVKHSKPVKKAAIKKRRKNDL